MKTVQMKSANVSFVSSSSPHVQYILHSLILMGTWVRRVNDVLSSVVFESNRYLIKELIISHGYLAVCHHLPYNFSVYNDVRHFWAGLAWYTEKKKNCPNANAGNNAKTGLRSAVFGRTKIIINGRVFHLKPNIFSRDLRSICYWVPRCVYV